MEIVNEFYDGMFEDMPADILNDFFMKNISDCLEEKLDSALHKLIGTEPVSYEEAQSVLKHSFEDEAFCKTLLLNRLHDFSATCKIKNASNKWVLDYFYLACLKELLYLKKVERVQKTPEFEEKLNVTETQINDWLTKLEVPVEKKGLFGRKKDDDEVVVDQIDPAELYSSMTNLTANVFQVYHSLIAGKEKERMDVNYAYKISIDEVDYDDIEFDDIKDAVKAAKIQKGAMAINVFENMLAIFYIKQCK